MRPAPVSAYPAPLSRAVRAVGVTVSSLMFCSLHDNQCHRIGTGPTWGIYLFRSCDHLFACASRRRVAMFSYCRLA